MKPVKIAFNSIQASILGKLDYNDMSAFLDEGEDPVVMKESKFVGIDNDGRFTFKCVDVKDRPQTVLVTFDNGSATAVLA